MILHARISQTQTAKVRGLVCRPLDLAVDDHASLQVWDRKAKLSHVEICHGQLVQMGGLGMLVFDTVRRSHGNFSPLYAVSWWKPQVDQQLSNKWIAAA